MAVRSRPPDHQAPPKEGEVVSRRLAFRIHRALFDPWAAWHRLTRHHWPFWYRTGYDFLTWRYECSICRPAEKGK